MWPLNRYNELVKEVAGLMIEFLDETGMDSRLNESLTQEYIEKKIKDFNYNASILAVMYSKLKHSSRPTRQVSQTVNLMRLTESRTIC